MCKVEFNFFRNSMFTELIRDRILNDLPYAEAIDDCEALKVLDNPCLLWIDLNAWDGVRVTSFKKEFRYYIPLQPNYSHFENKNKFMEMYNSPRFKAMIGHLRSLIKLVEFEISLDNAEDYLKQIFYAVKRITSFIVDYMEDDYASVDDNCTSHLDKCRQSNISYRPKVC